MAVVKNFLMIIFFVALEQYKNMILYVTSFFCKIDTSKTIHMYVPSVSETETRTTSSNPKVCPGYIHYILKMTGYYPVTLTPLVGRYIYIYINVGIHSCTSVNPFIIQGPSS